MPVLGTDPVRAAALALLVALTACTHASEPLRVVATTGVVADLARRVGGERVRVTGLLPAGGDPHAFQPTPADARALAGADVLAENGLGLEAWLAPLIDAAGFRGRRVVAADGGDALPLPHGGVDPHAWQDARNAARYADNLAEGFAAADPAGAARYRALATLAKAQLRALDAWMRRELDAVPRERRVLVTPHAAFAYFARAYGFEAVALAGPQDDAQAEPGAAAAIVARLRAAGVPAFAERGENPGPIANLAAAAGVRVAGELAADRLVPDGYDATQAANALTIAEALK